MLTETAPQPISDKSGRFWRWAAVAAVAIAAFVMVGNLDAAGLNGDEGFTAQMVMLPWTTMLTDLGNIDYNMTVHYVVLKAWTSVFGYSETALRVPSLVAVLFAFAVLYRLVVRIADRRLAALTVIFAALNPFVLMVGITARTYGFLFLWSVLSTLKLLQTLDKQNAAPWLLYGVIAVVGLHIHLLAAMVITAHGVFTLLHQRGLRRPNLAAALVIALFGLIPALIFLAPADTLAWIGPFSFSRAVTTGIAVAGGGVFGIVVAGLVLVGGLRPLQGQRRLSHIGALWFGVPLVLCLALAPVQSLFIDIYFAIVAAPLAILAAIGLDRLLATKAALAVPAGLVLSGVGLALGLTDGRVVQNQGWRELSQLMRGRVATEDVVAFPNSYYRIVAEYYAADPTEGPYPPASPTLPPAPWGMARPIQLDRLKRTGGQTDLGVMAAQISGGRGIWLVGTADELNREVADALELNSYRLKETVEFNNAMALLYVRG